MRLRKVLSCIAVFSCFALGVRGQTSFWNASSGVWSNGASWFGGFPPANNGTVNISFNLVSTYSSSVDVNYSVLSVNVQFGSGPFTLLGSSTLTVGSGGFNDNSGVNVDVFPILAGTMALTQSGNGTLTLHGANTYSGNTFVTSGTLADGGPNAYSPNSILDLGVLGTVDVGSNETVGGLIGSGGSVVISGGATLTVTGSTPMTFPGIISGSGGALNMNGYVLDLSHGNTYTGGTTVTAGTLEVDNASGSGTGTGAITIMPGATLQIGNGGGDVNGSINATAPIADNGTLTIAHTGPSTFANTISGTGGVLLVDNGATVTLTGNNTYSGPTTAQFGNLVAGSSNAFGNGLSAVDVVASGTLSLNGFSVSVGSISGDSSSFINIGSGTLTTGAANTTTTFSGVLQGNGQLSVVGTGTTILTGSSTFNGQVDIPGTAGVLQIGDGSTPGAHLAGASSFVDQGQLIFEPAGPDNFTYAGGISGGGEVLVQGVGTIKLGGTNTYSGLTSVGSGTLSDMGANSFSPNSAMAVDTLGTVIANSNETVGNLQNGIGGGQVSIAAGKTLTSLGLNYLADFQGVISGNGTFAVSSGVQGLSGNNNYSGGTLVSGTGELFVGSDNAVGSGVLMFNGTSTELSPDANVTLANHIVLVSELDNDDGGNNDLTLTGQINGPSSIVWCTPGALTLTNNGNNFSGGVDMREGTLYADANNAAGSGTITLDTTSTLNVMNGVTVGNPLNFTGIAATLAGNGTISTPVLVNSAVVLAPSASPGGGPGNLTFSNGLTLASGGSINFNLYDANGTPGSGYNLISATGGLNVAAAPGTITFNIGTINSSGGSAAAINFSSGNPYSWTFATSTLAITGFNPNQFNLVTSGFVNSTGLGIFSITGTTNDLMLNFTPVPEPSTWAMIGIGSLALIPAGLRRHRVRKT